MILRELAAHHQGATFGIVAPYRDFVEDVLESVEQDPLLKSLREKGQLLIGTAHRFQGSEVDYLIFATVAGDNGTDQERRWIENPNLFNVAVTRARRRLVLILSPVFERKLPLTRRLLRSSVIYVQERRPHHRPLLEQIQDILKGLGVPYRVNCSYHGYPVDLMGEGETPRWGVVVRGWDDLQTMTPIEALLLWDGLKGLRERGIKAARCLFPLDLDEWLADLLQMEPRRVWETVRRG